MCQCASNSPWWPARFVYRPVLTLHSHWLIISLYINVLCFILIWTFPPLCVDNNECATDPNLCGSNGVCQNTPGSFNCDCQRGFSLDPNGQSCEGLKTIDTNLNISWLSKEDGLLQHFFCVCMSMTDMDECDGNHRCQHGCQNLVGGYRCSCPQGYLQHYQWNQCVGK